jgi:hypothetical protein
MLTKLLAVLFAFTLLISSSSFVYSQTSDDKIRSDVAKRGTGEKAKVTVTTKSGVKTKGYITRADAETFDIRNEKTAQSETFNYRDVSKVQKPGWSKGAKIGLAIGIGVAVTAVVLTIAVKDALDNLGTISIAKPNQ